jgi:hypothetical protein
VPLTEGVDSEVGSTSGVLDVVEAEVVGAVVGVVVLTSGWVVLTVVGVVVVATGLVVPAVVGVTGALVVVVAGMGGNVVVGVGAGVVVVGGTVVVAGAVGVGVRIVVVGVGHTLPYAEQSSAAKAVPETPSAPTERPAATVSAAAVETRRLVLMSRYCMVNPNLMSLLRSVTDFPGSCKPRHALMGCRLIRRRGESCPAYRYRAYAGPVRTEVTVRDVGTSPAGRTGVAAGAGGCGGVTQC